MTYIVGTMTVQLLLLVTVIHSIIIIKADYEEDDEKWDELQETMMDVEKQLQTDEDNEYLLQFNKIDNQRHPSKNVYE